MEWSVQTPDGRTLAVEDAGDREGHGTLRENHIGDVHAWLAARL